MAGVLCCRGGDVPVDAAAFTDDDTVVFLTFDGEYADGVNPLTSTCLRNAATGACARQPTLRIERNAEVILDPDAPGREGGKIRNGLFGEQMIQNAASLHFRTNELSESRHTGMVVIPNSDGFIDGQGSFTAECFVLYRAIDSDKEHFLFSTHAESDEGVSLGKRFCVYPACSDGKLASTVLVDKDDGTIGSVTLPNIVVSDSVVDGKWHHIAFVYDEEAQTVALYLDYVMIKYKPGIKLTHARPRGAWPDFYVGGAYAAGYNAHDLQIDNVRVTRRALKMEEFLVPGKAVTIGDTIAALTFEPDSGTGLWPAPEALKPISTTGTQSFSNETWEAYGIRTVDGELIRRGNIRSRHFTKSAQLKWNNEQLSLFTNLTAATIEFFYKSDADAGVSSYANVIGFQGSRKDHPGEGGGVMSIQIANPSNSFRFAMNTTTAGNCVCAAPESYYKDHSPSCDGAWHHVAGVVSNEVDKVRMRLFIDYEERRTITFNGNIRRDLESMSLLVGGGFNGLLDEVRITAKALPVEKFLRRASAPGLTILFR